ncbi:hypothetical protein G3574_09640 [Noviherbaspirillum sp. 17J57-3]|uniref:Uncharacterized protein n=2 Tax=Noviherbaspirillum galbum TaxID=2709383 RepID=A0A6B3SKL2_9BURK|nr:hypothetical protein [Noviherbaspirillum galbum]
MALLFAQWAGLKHRIVHAALMQGAQTAMQTDASAGKSGGDADLSHSCLAFDAAATADALHMPPVLPPLLSSARVLSLWAAFLSWDAPPSLCFSSRAPPVRR